MGALYYGDNLTILREHVKDERVDLVRLIELHRALKPNGSLKRSGGERFF